MTADQRVCPRCLARAWLLARLTAHLEQARSRIEPLLALDDERLISAVAGRDQKSVRLELATFDADAARAANEEARVTAICHCHPAYPQRLRDLRAPPAVIHIAGDPPKALRLLAADPVAIVGSRAASPYGINVARRLARSLGAAGLTVISGMAMGIDSAAHAGALDVSAPTIAVLPGGAERAYPAARRSLHRRILESGAAVSELPPGAEIRRWGFPARNRIIAALAAMTVVVEAGETSGALVTARVARGLDRTLGAVPGRVTAPVAAGSNQLLAEGALLVRDAQDVLDALFGAGVRPGPAPEMPAPELRPLLAALADGHDLGQALERAGMAPDEGLAALAELELSGHVRRGAGGSFSVTS